MFYASSIRKHIVILRNYTINTCIRILYHAIFSNLYNRVLVNWPRVHCGVLQLTETSYLGPDSPRTSALNETVKECRRQMTVANSPVQRTWCRKWWNHSWHSSRVTLNQRCFAFIRPRTPLVYRFHVISRTQSHSVVLVAPHPDGAAPTAGPTARRWQLSNFCIGQIEYVPSGRHRLRQKQSLD